MILKRVFFSLTLWVCDMRLYYVTLNSEAEARQLGQILLERQLAVCVNWFPITCLYRWQGKLVEEPEVVLIIKTQAGYFDAITEVIREHVPYTQFTAELTPTTVNGGFLAWLTAEVPERARD
ncbi:MAG: divalent-cation tolerance protein CutA [Thermostichales cyanobacterium GMQP_bins_62]